MTRFCIPAIYCNLLGKKIVAVGISTNEEARLNDKDAI